MLSKNVILTLVLSLALFFGFAYWMHSDIETVWAYSDEDGFIENGTSVLFFVSAIGFFAVMARSDFLKQKNSKSAYLMTLAWALLMVVFAGEEISWGQRIIGIETPESLLELNKQQELNIHNLAFVDSFAGGKYRYLSIMMIMTGLLIPLFAMTGFGRRFLQTIAFPVSPLRYWILFVGAYVFGKYFNVFPIPDSAGLPVEHIATEFREFAMALGMACFALHGALRPSDLFGVSEPAGVELGSRDIIPST